MKLWLDAQLSPSLAPWLEETFDVEVLAIPTDASLISAGDEEIFEAARAAAAVAENAGPIGERRGSGRDQPDPLRPFCALHPAGERIVTLKQRTAGRVGFRAATGLGVVGVLYALVTAFGIARAGSSDPIVDPVLAIMEALTLLSAPLVVILFAAIHSWASDGRSVWSLVALAFGILMAGLTSAVHFVGLSAGRQAGRFVLEWPSVPYAVELLAWDVFLGLALLFAAPVFSGRGLESAVRRAFAVSGALCLVGAAGPLLNDMELQRVGMAGYGIGLPISCFLLAAFFRRPVNVGHDPASNSTSTWTSR